MDGYDLNLVVVVLLVMYLCYCVIRHKCLAFDNFVLCSFICTSRSILFMDVEKIPKSPAKSMRATLACLLTCVWIAHVL